MTLAEYRTLTTRTLPDLGRPLVDEIRAAVVGKDIPNDVIFKLGLMTGHVSNKLNYLHMAVGLASEVGELVECIGTDLRFDVDKVNLAEEIGDLYWYLANYANMRNINLPEKLDVVIPEEECLDFLIIKVGTLVDIIKKYAAYNKELDRAKEAMIVCDVRLALLLMEHTYDLNGADIRARNIQKLQDKQKGRYKDGFTEQEANNRNLNNERELLS